MAKEQPKPRVFISYVHQDRSVAEKIQERLETSGSHLWLFHKEISSGDSFESVLQRTARSGDFLLVLLSSNSTKSQWAGMEFGDAPEADLAARDITVLPVRTDDARMPEGLATYPWFDLREQSEEQLQRLANLIAGIPRIDFGSLSPRDFEKMVAELLITLRFFNVKLPRGSADRGIDITADYKSKDEFGAAKTERWFIQVKYTRHERLSLDYFSRLASDVYARSESGKGLFVTNGIVSSVAKEFLNKAGRSDVRVVEGPELKRLLAMHPQLTEKYFAGLHPPEQHG